MTKENREAIEAEINLINKKLAAVPVLDRNTYSEWCVAEWVGKGMVGTYTELCSEVVAVKEKADEDYADYLKERYFSKRVKIVEESDLRDAFYFNSELPSLANGDKVFDGVYERSIGVWIKSESVHGIAGTLFEVLSRFERDELAIMEAVQTMEGYK